MTTPDKKFDLGDYVEVKDRIKLFYELYAGGRLVTETVGVVEVGPTSYVMVRALAYRTVDDPHPGTGTSWLAVPGSTSYTKGSEVENAETSAWGRAIGSLGILIDRSIASSQEVQNKQEDKPKTYGAQESLVGDLSRSGKIAKGGAMMCDLEWRQGPDGHAIGFTLQIAGDKSIPQCVVKGPLGEALWFAMDGGERDMKGMKVHVTGRLYAISEEGRTTFHRLYVSKIETDEFVLPSEAEAAA